MARGDTWNHGGKRSGSGSKPGVKRGRYNRHKACGNIRTAPLKAAERRHRKKSLRISREAAKILARKDFNLNQAVLDFALLEVPEGRQKRVEGGRIQVCPSVSPAAFAIINSKANSSAFVEAVCLRTQEEGRKHLEIS